MYFVVEPAEELAKDRQRYGQYFSVNFRKFGNRSDCAHRSRSSSGLICGWDL